MFKTNFSNYLDIEGNISKSMPKEAREMASFLALLIDAATLHIPEIIWTTDFKCFNSNCECNTITKFVDVGDKIWWYCPDCECEGLIYSWQRTRWGNTEHV